MAQERLVNYEPVIVAVRFYALTRILKVSGPTLYQWRGGKLANTPALPVVVVKKPGTKKPDVWVEVAKLRD